MHSRKLASLGLATILSLAAIFPVLAQSAEAKAYQAIQDERDERKLKSLTESFVTTYPNSQYRPQLDLKLMGYYYSNKDYALMVKHADSFALTQGAADAKSKSQFFTVAMEGARLLGNQAKFVEYAEKALSAEPENIGVLMTISRFTAESAPNDGPAKVAAIDKALGYAQRAQKVSKPATITDADWNGTQARLHGLLGLIYGNKSQWVESAKELELYLKSNPGDGISQYRYGFAYYSQLQTTLATLQAANTEARAAQAKGAEDVIINGWVDKLNSLSKDFETQRDIVIDAMAKTIAIGGTISTQAKSILDPLYKQKNNSLDGIDAFIAAKKTELAALTPVAAPVIPQGRGGTTPPTAGGGARGGK